MNKRQLFLQHVGQTGPQPLGLEVDRAEGMYIYDVHGKKYLDLNSGISVSSLGHRHPHIIAAIRQQTDAYLHTMVYGEHIQSPQVRFASRLAEHLNNGLDAVFFVNSGSEAVEVALKLARKATRRYEILSFSKAYHGSTMAAEALRSDTEFTSAFMPGLPGVGHFPFNDENALSGITEKTACVVAEAVQAEAGVIPPNGDFLKKLEARCRETGTLFILDEIQTGFGRTGKLFAHQKYGIRPDILLIAKSMGAGMPVGACVASQSLLSELTDHPALGHITTFGGHPVCIAAADANLSFLLESDLVAQVHKKEALFRSLLDHHIIAEVRSSGLMMAVELTRRKYLKHVVAHAFESGALVDFFLFNDRSFRLCPPLIISEEEIKTACSILLKAMDFAVAQYKK